MSLLRYAKRRDDTEERIVEALRRFGCSIIRNDTFDLLVLRGSTLYALECKSKDGRLTETQKRLRTEGWPIHIVYTVEDALKAVGLYE